MGIFFFLDASTQLFSKLVIITSYNMIKMGGVIQGGDNSVSTQNQRCHQLLLKTNDPHFHLVYNTRCCKDLTSRPL